jgi:very-short-patch-repair endonuclease
MKYDYIPYDKKLKSKARELRNNMTAAEKKLWYEYLRNHKYRFLRQKPIGNFIVDFYCSKLKLVIEVDGETHIDKSDILYDQRRTKELESYGLKVLRFWNYDVLGGIGAVQEIIEKEILEMEKSF